MPLLFLCCFCCCRGKIISVVNKIPCKYKCVKDVMSYNLIRIFPNWSFLKGIACKLLLGQVFKQVSNTLSFVFLQHQIKINIQNHLEMPPLQGKNIEMYQCLSSCVYVCAFSYTNTEMKISLWNISECFNSAPGRGKPGNSSSKETVQF